MANKHSGKIWIRSLGEPGKYLETEADNLHLPPHNRNEGYDWAYEVLAGSNFEMGIFGIKKVGGVLVAGTKNYDRHKTLIDQPRLEGFTLDQVIQADEFVKSSALIYGTYLSQMLQIPFLPEIVPPSTKVEIIAPPQT